MYHLDELDDGTKVLVHTATNEIIMRKSGPTRLFGDGGWQISPSFQKETTNVPWEDICCLIVKFGWNSGML